MYNTPWPVKWSLKLYQDIIYDSKLRRVGHSFCDDLHFDVMKIKGRNSKHYEV